ncbi:DUF3685 domain-containing protein [Scytonema sp. NUACC21]
MSDRPLKLLLIDQDPIFRLGLQVALEAAPELQVVSEAETDTTALQILAELAQNDPNHIDLVVLELGNGRSISSQQLGLLLCQQLKIQYPNLPLLLLSSTQEQGLLLAAKAAGVNGYCAKGTSVSELVAAMQAVASGGSYWHGKQEDTEIQLRSDVDNGESFSVLSSAFTSRLKSYRLPFTRLRNHFHSSGIFYINANLATVTKQLQVPGLPLLERAILAGQRRELLAARWLLHRLLTSSLEREQTQQDASHTKDSLTPGIPHGNYFASNQSQFSPDPPLSSALSNSEFLKSSKTPVLLSPRALQAALFASCIAKLQFPLGNLTDIALETDILRWDKKRELFYLILQKIADALDEMRASQVEIHQLYSLKDTVLFDIWREATIDFFGKFSRIKVSDRSLEIVNILLQDAAVVQREILSQIPLVVEMFSYLLFQTNLQIDNTLYPAGSPEAKVHAENILENILIQIANGVIQPLLNSLADVEAIKQVFYDRQLISTREIEKFRNNLSWKYRLRNYVLEPKAIFESRYELFIFAPRGIAMISIYASRTQELAQLSGVPLIVTLGLEFRDALTPRLQSLLSFLGNGIVFVLTRIVGRGIGLIARGIIQGIGNVSLPERKK